MRNDAAERQCSHLLRRRAQRQATGGVGLLMGSGFSTTESARRRLLRGRLLKIAATCGLLVLCTAGGFASAKLWDARGTSDLDLDLAGAIATDDALELEMRRNGLGRLHYFADAAVEALREAQRDPALEEWASALLGKISASTGRKGSFADYLSRVQNPDSSLEQRGKAMGQVHAYVMRGLVELLDARAGDDPDLRARAEQYLDIIERRVFGREPR